jgi:hypothetical protein
MVVLMIRALVAAGLAGLSTQLANLLGEIAVSSHVTSGQSADRSTVHVQGNAPCHHLHVFFFQARARTAVASICASIASINTGLVVLFSHEILLITKYYQRRTSAWQIESKSQK